MMRTFARLFGTGWPFAPKDREDEQPHDPDWLEIVLEIALDESYNHRLASGPKYPVLADVVDHTVDDDHSVDVTLLAAASAALALLILLVVVLLLASTSAKLCCENIRLRKDRDSLVALIAPTNPAEDNDTAMTEQCRFTGLVSMLRQCGYAEEVSDILNEALNVSPPSSPELTKARESPDSLVHLVSRHRLRLNAAQKQLEQIQEAFLLEAEADAEDSQDECDQFSAPLASMCELVEGLKGPA